MITREEFMMNALGADADTLMEVLHELLSSVNMAFTREEAVVLRAMMADPEAKMHVATLLTDGAEKCGMFE